MLPSMLVVEATGGTAVIDGSEDAEALVVVAMVC